MASSLYTLLSESDVSSDDDITAIDNHTDDITNIPIAAAVEKVRVFTSEQAFNKTLHKKTAVMNQVCTKQKHCAFGEAHPIQIDSDAEEDGAPDTTVSHKAKSTFYKCKDPACHFKVKTVACASTCTFSITVKGNHSTTPDHRYYEHADARLHKVPLNVKATINSLFATGMKPGQVRHRLLALYEQNPDALEGWDASTDKAIEKLQNLSRARGQKATNSKKAAVDWVESRYQQDDTQDITAITLDLKLDGDKFSVLVTSKALLANYHRVKEAMIVEDYSVLAVDGTHRLTDAEFPGLGYGIIDAEGSFHLLGLGLAVSENAETVASQLKTLKVQYSQSFPQKPTMEFEMAIRDASQAIHNGIQAVFPDIFQFT